MTKSNHNQTNQNEISKFKPFEHAETVVRSLNPGIWEWRIQTGELTLNERWANMLGYALTELEPISIATWETYTHPEDLEKAKAMIQTHFEGACEFYEMELRMHHKDGSWIWVFDRGQVVEWDAQGKPALMVGSHIDITDHKRLEALRNTEKYQELIENAPFPIILVSVANGSFLYGNRRAKDQFGFQGDEGVGLPTADFYVNTHDREHFLTQLKTKGYIYDFEVQLYTYQRRKYWALMSASFTEYLGEMAILVTINDITARKSAETALNHERDTYKLISETMGDVIWVYNTAIDRFTYVSPSVVQLRGYTPEEMMKQSIREVITPETLSVISADRETRVAHFLANPNQSIVYYHEVQQTRKDGTLVWVELSTRYRMNDEGQIEVVGSSRNIEERKKTVAQIAYLNTHDQVTGLLNRTAFRQYEQTLLQKEEIAVSILYLDFDQFGLVNDTYGHHVGDQVILRVAHAIEHLIGHRGQLYHFDGDEFIVVVFSDERNQVEQLAQQLNRIVAEPFTLDNQIISLTASIGIALGTNHCSLETLFTQAATALYVAKRTRNTAKIFSQDMEKAQTRETRLETDLSAAVESNQLELYFQPIYDVRSGKVMEAEALLRWNHPDLGMISPVEFIPIAERTRLIIPITDWVIKRALQVLSRWEADDSAPLTISVNVSYVTLANRGEELYKFLQHELLVSGVAAQRLKLEITESSLVQDASEVIKVFIRLKELGIRVALDDFGTGYSSFAYLKALPLDIVKIDRFLVRTLEWDSKSRMIIESMITILHALGLEVVIEGVETLAQFELLRSMKADKIQGYLFSRPVNLEALKTYYRMAMESVNLPVKPFNGDWPEIRMQWHREWDCGEPTIDQQHHDLMRKAADIERLSLLDKPNPEMVKMALSALMDAITTHFTDEERILKDRQFEGLSEHQAEHQSLLARANAFVAQFEAGEIDLYVFVPFLVREVVWDHLLKEDIKYFPLLGVEVDERMRRQFETISSAEEQRFRGQLRENAGLQTLLASISSRLINVDSSDADDKINQVLELCGHHFDADRVYIFNYDWQKKTLKNTYEWCQEGIEPQIDQLEEMPIEFVQDWVDAHLQGETIVIERVSDMDPNSVLRQALEPQGIISLVTVPMMADNVCAGFIGFDSVRKQRKYTDLERAMLRELSNLLLVTLKRKALDEKLSREKAFYEMTVSTLDEALVIIDEQRRITFMNPVAEKLVGKTLTDLRGQDIRLAMVLVHAETEEPIIVDESEMEQPGFSRSLPPGVGFRNNLGQMVLVAGRTSALRTPNNDLAFVINFRDITSEVEAKRQIDAFLNVNLDLLCVADLDGHFIQVNRRFTEVLGYSTRELTGIRFLDLVHPEDVQPTLDLLADLPTLRRIDGFINRYITLDGRYVYIEWSAEVGSGKYLYASGRDVTERIEQQSEYEYNAFHDSMTGLFNRRYLEERFKTLANDRRSHPVSVVIADVDGLKTTNDTLGHQKGDELIQKAAKRLTALCRPSDVIGRWGGDEFMLILPKTSEEDGEGILQRILQDGLLEDGTESGITLSVGLATKKTLEDQFPDVVRTADQRMYAMKSQHRFKTKD
jgi:diguanylate cyclase (GGDEF)-like protein/hemerythrin-like metal-binding protein/PAS domain S-box-containing protein